MVLTCEFVDEIRKADHCCQSNSIEENFLSIFPAQGQAYCAVQTPVKIPVIISVGKILNPSLGYSLEANVSTGLLTKKRLGWMHHEGILQVNYEKRFFQKCLRGA